MKKLTTVSHQEVCELICDGCGLEASVDEGYEFGEFITISHQYGYRHTIVACLTSTVRTLLAFPTS